MDRLPPILVISLCLVCITIGAMLAGDALVGVAPDQTSQVFATRKTLSEQLAVQYTVLAATGHLQGIDAAMRALVAANSHIQSIALQATDGQRIAVAGDHDRSWVQPSGSQSTVNHIQVPIYKASVPWGTLQVSFKPLHSSWDEQLFTSSWSRFLAVVAVLIFIGSAILMKRMLRHLDPSEVIPPRVKDALDSLTDGIVMLAPSGSIVLANEAFCRLIDQPLSSILGSSLSRFPWDWDSKAASPGVAPRPWDEAITHRVVQQGVRLGVHVNHDRPRTLSVTSMPILDERGELRGVLVSFHDVTDVEQAHALLRDTVLKLEHSQAQVVSQNEQLAQTNATLQHEIEERKRILVEREALNQQLLESSRLAGRAEVASTVLHNVGNVLNSVNVSVDVAMRTLKQVPLHDVALIASLLQQHRHELESYLSEDLQGKQIPSYLAVLADTALHHQALMETELAGLSRNVDHIRQVVNRQVQFAKPSGATWESVRFQDLMEHALALYRPALDRQGCEIVECYDRTVEGRCDRHQMLQILINLVSNAKNAMEAMPDTPHRLTLRLGFADDRPGFARFEISDTGIGIAAEHVPRLFKQGFTTRPDGHGIGLHSASLAARSFGGSLQARSDGPGHGASFILDVPLAPVMVLT